MNSRVICKLPRAGLGNQLFPLLRAFMFADINQLPVTVTNYHQVKIGPWLRGEKVKRKYNRFFTFQQNLLLACWQAPRRIMVKNIVDEPPIKLLPVAENVIYRFSCMPHWDDHFVDLKDYRQRVIEILYQLVRPGIIRKLDSLPAPVIGVHIRMGDFKSLPAGADFSQHGATRTPLDYFITIIDNIRQLCNQVVPVTIFSDGYAAELKPVLDLAQVSLSEGNNDLVDLLLLSKSKIIITSAGSTFSYWAGFLADAPVIMHTAHLHAPLRPAAVNQMFYEGPWDASNKVLQQNLHAIAVSHNVTKDTKKKN